jgi:AcrR family transcriptional regulator
MIESKERILSIALYYFLKKPYTEVTMSEILKASGLSKGGFYHHFESKEMLYHDVVDRFILETFSTEFGHFTDNPYNLPFREFIPFYIKSTLGHLIELAESRLSEFDLKIEEVNLYMVMFDMMKHYKGFDSVLEQLHTNEITMFKTLIDKAKEKGEVKKDLDSLSLANHVHTLMHGIFILAMFDDKMENLENKIRNHFDNFYQLIKA